jgi:hypothetical protein
MQVNRSLSDPHFDRIDHALGRPLDPAVPSYRNHYALAPDDPARDWLRVSEHWHRTGSVPGGLEVYAVTPAGRAALCAHLRELGERHRRYLVTYAGDTSAIIATSRQKARYAAYLNRDDCLSFAAFCHRATVSVAPTNPNGDL